MSIERLMDEANAIMSSIVGMGIYDMPDFRWGDYDDPEEALYDAVYYWMDYGDIPPEIGDMIIESLDF